MDKDDAILWFKRGFVYTILSVIIGWVEGLLLITLAVSASYASMPTASMLTDLTTAGDLSVIAIGIVLIAINVVITGWLATVVVEKIR